jgi:hypothetical protein
MKTAKRNMAALAGSGIGSSGGAPSGIPAKLEIGRVKLGSVATAIADVRGTLAAGRLTTGGNCTDLIRVDLWSL